MSVSRRQLYAMGEPLGESATSAKLGGGYVCGGGGGSKSSQSSANYDQRVAVQDGIGLSGSSGNTITASSSTHYNITDGGIVTRGLQSVDSAFAGMLETTEKTYAGALDAVRINNATNADSFTKMLDMAGDMFKRSEGLIGQTQKSVADAYSMAQADAKGTVDNRTIMVIAVAGIAAFAFAHQGK
jgi:hypothetical protein